jgi:hypothetical protein
MNSLTNSSGLTISALVLQADVAIRDLDRLVEPARQVEIAVHAEPGTGAVLPVLVEDERLLGMMSSMRCAA